MSTSTVRPKGEQQDEAVAARRPQQLREVLRFAHGPGDHDQHRGQACQGEAVGEWRQQQHEQQQEPRMQHAGDRRARA
jgi:hypothetical protein